MGAGEGTQQKEVLGALEALKRASEDIVINPCAFADESCAGPSPFVKALLALQAAAADLLSGDPRLSALSNLLSRLKSLVSSSCSPSSLRRPSARREISRLAASISSEIDSWIHRESLHRLASLLRFPSAGAATNEDEIVRLLLALESCVSHGFDRGLQEALLRSGTLPAVESVLASHSSSNRVRNHCAAAVLALVRFNKDVFVGQVMMGASVSCLVAMGSAAALRALAGLISAIRSPLIDELLAKGEIPQILALLPSPELEVRILALECVLEIGYFGRNEAVDAMMNAGVVKRLIDLQRSEVGGGDEGLEKGGKEFTERRPFASAVVRFAVAVEVGEGLRQREKRKFKLEVLRQTREAAADEAEAATIAAEVLWGSTSW